MGVAMSLLKEFREFAMRGNVVDMAVGVICSCPLISRQGLYLKLTLPADADILADCDNPCLLYTSDAADDRRGV